MIHGGTIYAAYNIKGDFYTEAELWKRKFGKTTLYFVVDYGDDFKLYMYKDIINLRSEWKIRPR